MAPDSRIEGKLHTWVGHSCNKQGDSARFWSSFKFCSSKFLKRLFSDLKDSSFSSTGLFLVSLPGSCWWFSWRWWCWVNSIAFHATSATSMTVFATSTAPWPPMGTFCWTKISFWCWKTELNLFFCMICVSQNQAWFWWS